MGDDGRADEVRQDTEIELPPALALLWGRTDRPRSGPRPGLSLEAIIEAAVEVADADGLEGLSMAKVAQRLGFTTMSLYRYVSGKDVLLVLMSDRASRMPAEVIPESGDWRTRLETWTRAQLDMYQSRPWLVDIKITGPPLLPSSMDWMEHGLRAVADTPLNARSRLGVIEILTGYVRNQARFSRDLGQRDPQQHSSTGYGQALAQLVDSRTHWALVDLVGSGILDGAPDETLQEGYLDEDFDFGLKIILDGIAAMIAEHGSD
ncbi:TetR/AcrR family transcriptional regulator [Actinoalloteichus hymeniacidonis]|uniref:Transcriptional regulator, TetR family n=1 Tax=Actinoalloteichus hymeniacidonis TaxID=340345 RepID=A0AAC9HPJ1_9PSEU|nr:TetR/AcrR family transcriptional regulator [Actinoalloteichus hymeniacidonis]AOS62948.1 transcriptional regulator, TetR family [Actinoalloteichus hymeniacidonis]MBB5909017.1 AcrR family transcriptional regulator [Actinoalloteichus hymeniacidonis]